MSTIESGQRLPDPLAAEDGSPVTTAAEWTAKRRPELLELFRRNVYGRAPVGRPAELTFTVEETTPDAMEGAATRRRVAIQYAGPGGKGSISLVLFVPNTASPRRAPAFVLLCNRGAGNIDPERLEKSAFWPAEEIVARGYAAAAFVNADIDPDTDDGFQNGAHGIFDSLFPGGRRPDDAWGSIAAWAWGASRVMDYLETDSDIDPTRVALVGHSRGGKTTLWAGAEDTRFGLVVSNNSGSTGAAISRGKKGEDIARINKVFPHWFCKNYHAFGGREADLPVDQHELLSLIAPRPLYVASATEDEWADPEAEFRSCVAASPVYTLLGKQGVGAEAIPPPETPLQTGDIGYHLRTGKHDLTVYDWQRFMDFADRQWGRP